MALPTREEVLEIDISKDGGPWVNVAAKSDIDLDGLDWSKDGSPWWGLEIMLPPVLPKFIPSVTPICEMMFRGSCL